MSSIELNEHAETVLKSNIEILYSQLNSAIQDYLHFGHCIGEFRYVNAYLGATLNALVSYIDRLIEVGRFSETDIVQALKFANNLQKHNPQLICMSKAIGGLTFPMCFEEEFSIPEIQLVWDDCIGLKTKKLSQREAYEKCFQQQPIAETLEPIVRELLSGKI